MAAATHVTKELVNSFIDSRTGSVQRTLTAYRTAMTLVVAWEIPIDNDMLRAFDYALARRTFKKTVREKIENPMTHKAEPGKLKTASLKYSATTRRLYVTVLKQFLYWLDAEERAPDAFNRTKAEDKLRASRGKRARVSYEHRSPDQDLMAIVEHFDQRPPPPSDQRDAPRLTLELLRNRALMHLLRCTGGRVSEILSLKRMQVQDGQLDEVQIVGKGGKARTLFLDPPALSAVSRYCSERKDTFEALIISHRRGRGQPLTPSSAWQIVKRAAKLLGLKGLASPHMFRHYLAEDMLRSGTALEGVQAVLGHADIATTRKVYAPANVDEAREPVGLP